MKKIIISAISVLLLATTSCAGFLTEDPKSFVAPTGFYSTEDEVISALYGSYQYLHNENIGDFGWIFYGDQGTDVAVTRSVPRYNVYMQYDMEAQTIDNSNCWRDHYQAIGSINMLIGKVEKSSFSDEFKKQIIGEAKFLRALYYHQLILLWGDVPMWLDELDISTVDKLPRTAKKEVLLQIYADLKYAIDNLALASKQQGRVNAWTAKALLSRVALLESDWQTAYNYSKDVISGDGTPFSLVESFAELFRLTNKFNKEMILVTPCLSDVRGSQIHSACSPRPRDEQANTNPFFAAGKKALRPDGVWVNASSKMFEGWGTGLPLKHLIDSYEVSDTRKEQTGWHSVTMDDGRVAEFTGGDGGGKGYYFLKWLAFEEKANNGIRDIQLMRLGEVYLILAESANELNKEGEAIAALNKLRERAFGNTDHNYPATIGKEAIKTAIVNENKWELAGEGLRRWYLIHWGFDYLKNAVLSVADETPVTKTAAQNIKPHHVLFMIPVTEIEKNPNLAPNNPGY